MIDNQATEMRGPAGVRADVAAYLRTRLPVHAEACRAAWGLTEAQLPLPASAPDDPRADAYLPRQAVALDRWPMLAVTTGRRAVTRGRGQYDYTEDGSLMLSATYATRIYVWVRDEGHDATLEARDNLATALELTCLSDVYLGTGGRLSLVPSTLVVDYSEVDKVKGDRFVAGAYVGFDLGVAETLTDRLTLPGGQPRDTVSGVTAAGSPLPPHPALQ